MTNTLTHAETPSSPSPLPSRSQSPASHTSSLSASLVSPRPYLAITLILLVVAASRILHITSFTMNWDEVWSIWQTFGSPADIIRWTPNDWPPLYFLLLGGWKEIAGIQPAVLRVSSLFAAMLGAAFTYRAARRLGGERAALLTTLVYGALGFSIFLGLLVRAYTFLLALTSLAIWLTLRYFDRPTLWRGLALASVCAVMWFMHYTAAFIFMLLGLLTLYRYHRAIWRWWLPGGIVAAVGVITVLTNREVFETRTGYNGMLPLPPLPQALAEVYGAFTYPVALLWLILFLIAGGLLLRSQRLIPIAAAFLIWAGAPVAVYFLNSRLGLFQDIRYLWWALPGVTFWIGLGLSLLPRRVIQPIAALMIAGIALIPFPLNDYQASEFRTFAPVDTNFELLRENMLPGDVLLVDPNCGCAPYEVWDYYERIYFPNGLPFVTSANGHRRVWYVSVDGANDPTTFASVQWGRVAGKYFGPPDFLIRLYEAPPDPVGILYPNGMRFHGAEIEGTLTPIGYVFHEGETVKLRLWWSVDEPVSLDYSLSLQVFGSDGNSQIDGPPNPTSVDASPDGIAPEPNQTSQWQPGRFYVDEGAISLPYPLDPGTYPLWMAVYFWQDEQRLPAEGVDERGLLQIAQVYVHSW